jgi:hypothetical protein
MLRTAFLWIHVSCGALWVVVSLSFVLAAGATPANERAGFAARVSARFNRLNLIAIALVPLSGIANLGFVAREHHDRLPAAFVEVLGAKVTLLCAMAVALAMAWSATGAVAKDPSRGAADPRVRRLLWLYGAMALAGAVALMLGVWLAGSV